MLKTIVVALDGSDNSPFILSALETLAIQPSTKIVLCHVLPTSGSEEIVNLDRPHPLPAGYYQQAEKQLLDFQAQLSEGQSEIEIVSGDPAEEIIRLANIHQANLIAIGTRGLQGIERIVEGSVSSQVVAEAPCSVLVVRETPPYKDGASSDFVKT